MTAAPVWTRRIADEFWSGPVTPLTFSLLAETMAERMVRRPLRTAGLPALAAAPVLRHHASHVYANASLLAEVIGMLPAGLLSEGLLAILPLEARSRLRGASWWHGGARAVAIAARLLLREPRWAPWQRAAAFDAECAAVRGAFAHLAAPPADASAAELHADMARVRDRLGDYLAVVSWGVVFGYVFYHLLHELTRRWAPGLVEERAALTVGLTGIASLEAHHELLGLGRQLHDDPILAVTLADAGAVAAWHAIAAGRGGVTAAFNRFLDHHGHRLTGRDLACPTWREAPEVVVALAGGGRDPRGSPALRRAGATMAIERAVGAGAGGSVRRAIFAAALGAAQRYYVVRENMRYYADYFLARLRQLGVALGGLLATGGQLARPDDVWFLDFDELGAAASGDDSCRARVDERRAVHARAALEPPAETLAPPDVHATSTSAAAPALGSGGAALAHSQTAGAGTTRLAGEAGSPGRCRGTARLVHGPADFDRIGAGDVIVATYTDPAWTPILERACGLVLEAGGLLSHGAIVARELGIPALVGVTAATRAIRDGDTVELNAAAGEVAIVAPAR